MPRTAIKRKNTAARAATHAVARNSPPAVPISVGLLPNLLGYNVRRAQIALWRDFSRTVGEGEVRPAVFSMLVLVDENPGIAQTDLADQLDIDKATVVGLVDRLQARRWITRKQSSVDKRRQGIFLTAAGSKNLLNLRNEMLIHEARFTRFFSAEELAQLFTFLRRIHS
jgi:DNA-binding MarR family transcriptional regulator